MVLKNISQSSTFYLKTRNVLSGYFESKEKYDKSNLDIPYMNGYIIDTLGLTDIEEISKKYIT